VFGRRDIEELRAGMRVFEKHCVEIAQPKTQQRILRQFAFNEAILRHHRGELCAVAGDRAPLYARLSRSEPEIFQDFYCLFFRKEKQKKATTHFVPGANHKKHFLWCI